MKGILFDKFGRQIVCSYRGERYSVRDNGAVFRHRRTTKRIRPLDEHWTLGRANKASGYTRVSTEVVHRIVATAFLGDPPSKSHVVDHIDTNRLNNRPENLRWVSRLENILLNPITAKRVMLAYGSIENFLADPSSPRRGGLSANLTWMRTVTPQEAEISRNRLLAWAASDKGSSGGSLGDWVFRPRGVPVYEEDVAPKQKDLVNSKTPGAAQLNWKIPSEFPCCPATTIANPTLNYARRLTSGETFARNRYSESKVLSVAQSDNQQVLWVMCDQGEEAIKQWSVAQITFQGELFIHENLGSFFTLQGAQKRFCLA
jgi:hypothetical protein